MSAATTIAAPTRAAAVGARFARELVYLLIAFATSIVAFCVWVAGVTVALSFAVLIIGIPVAIVVFWVFRWTAELDRRNAALVLGSRIRTGYRPRDAGGWLARIGATLTDPQSWRDLGWLMIHSLLGFGFGIVAITLVATTLGLTTLPAWAWTIPEDTTVLVPWNLQQDWVVWATWLMSIPVAVLTVALVRAMAIGHSALARALLGRDEAELERRVERLEETRAGAVSAASEQLERIERDLHDGAQARLVALAVDLGLARERFDENPEEARKLVAEAAEEAKLTLAELRDLARGLRPALLAERGLDEAVCALAARVPLATELDIDPGGADLPREIESAAYFVVAEALTNVAKHSGAARAEVRIARSGGLLVAEVRDDGSGAADPAGSGLDGLRRRVEALDGRLSVLTGSGAGTSVRAELPCEP